jgi:exopolyphosphatase/guanosine-5'-triphosphate,3'-diphosphate pyrophosphatase
LYRLAEFVASLGRKSLRRIEGVPSERLPSLPFGALALAHLLRRMMPGRAVFCAHGLREGLIFEMLPRADRAEDPLLATCRREAAIAARFAGHADELMAWLSPLFPEELAGQLRLRHAACLLSDIAWRVHPDYRAEHAFVEMLRAPLAGAEHTDRAWLALALHARYTGGAGGEAVASIAALLGRPMAVEARCVGLALRLAHTISGGAAGLLSEAGLKLQDGVPRMTLRGRAEVLRADVVMRRFESLVRAFESRSA